MIQNAELADLLRPLARTIETVLPEADLLRKLRRKTPLRVKFGIDPTSASVHVGNGIPLWNLRRLQEMGHQAVLIIGDYTALVGDPSGKDKTRPMLTTDQVAANVRTWLDQIGRIVDLTRAEVRRNGEWFSKMPFLEVLALADRMTVQQMLERESFDKRFHAGAPISIREFLYCLMQGWDSVVVRADIELGGTDQLFNLGVGRKLMEQEGLEPQVSLISPLVEGTDGQAKMSKSLGNSIGLADPPRDMFGLAMRISDALLPKYLRLLTVLPDAEIERLLAPGAHPRDAKLAMAEALVSRYHGADVGAAQRAEFISVISEGAAPSDIAVKQVPGGALPAWELLRQTGLAASGTQARQLLREGAVTGHVAGATRVGDGYSLPAGAYRIGEKTFWPSGSGDLVQVGSRRWVRLEVDPALPPYAAPAGAPPLSAPVPKDAK